MIADLLTKLALALVALSHFLQSILIAQQGKRIKELESFRDNLIEGIVEAVEDE